MNLVTPDFVLGSVAVLFVVVLLYASRSRQLSNQHHLPPGPRPLPLIGNAHQMPFEYPEQTFARWKGLYGDLIFLRMFSTPLLVVNSARAARDLLEKRSAKYSDRPYSVLFIDLIGWDAEIGIMNYGERFKKHRRWVQAAFFDKAALAQLLPVQIREAHTLLANLLRDPENFARHLHRFSGASMLETLYGHSVTDDDDEYLKLIDKANDTITSSSAPGAALVDFLPFLQYTPAWLPGAGWKRKVLEARDALKEASTRCYALAEAQAHSGKPSIISSIIKECSDKGILASQEHEIMHLGSVTYSAGTDTTKSVLHSFVLAMVLHPETYRKAQQEMDTVLGRDRLPTLEHRDSLPYLECVLKETYRWLCPICLSIPHASCEDDEYNGYFIPKGTAIIPNLWLMLRDPEVYSEPDLFRPERFWALSSEESERTDPRNIVFGHGRRICPGRRFADAGVWLAIAGMVATFHIQKTRDASGKEVTPPALYESGFTSVLSNRGRNKLKN
ncbi:hypothetical protein EVJ58_g7609 [Rhodofomes roseus]|uniref:Cytochrome P450 n=1 Tax=Rhodofomes roseus TaxID=34475 RepID=A0A4Y9Y214_9APHY|nr:hypothetical protein EVJ58_g7609 [Rhodofomes roseus]